MVRVQGGVYPVAWISLDEGDNDPVRFLSYMITALQNVQEGLGQDVVRFYRDLKIPSTRRYFRC